MGTGLAEVLHPNRESKYRVLEPLLEGKPVALLVNDPQMRLKKRVGNPVMLLTPVSVYGMEGDDVVLVLPGYGAEVISPTRVKATDIYRVGLTMRTSKILSQAIQALFLERHTHTPGENP